MAYPSYLIHYNKNHSKKNGQFVSGDGDGDGTADEHHRYSKNGVKDSKSYNIQKEYDSSWGRNRYTISSINKIGNKNVDKMSNTSKKKINFNLRDGVYTTPKDKKLSDKQKNKNDEISKKYDQAMKKVLDIYNKTGNAQKAAKVLADELSGESYVAEMSSKNYKQEGDRFISVALEVYGNKKAYTLYGDSIEKNNKFIIDDDSIWSKEVENRKRTV